MGLDENFNSMINDENEVEEMKEGQWKTNTADITQRPDDKRIQKEYRKMSSPPFMVSKTKRARVT